MKNYFKIFLFVVALCTLPGLSKAQAFFPFTINNTLSCPVMVRWMVSCPTCPPPAAQQTNPTELIPPGTFTISTAVFMAATNSGWTPTNTEVSVQIIEIAGNNLAFLGLVSPYVDSSTPPFSGIGYPCQNGPTLDMNWTPTMVTIF